MAAENLNRILECPICYVELDKEIYQCPEGHLLCSNCIAQYSKVCLTCQMKMPKKPNLNRILECPICYVELDKEIYQCPEGHLICSSCIAKYPKVCLTCQVKMPKKPIRNRALEFIALSSVLVPQIPTSPPDTSQATTSSKMDPAVKKRKASEIIHAAYCDGPACKSLNQDRIHGVRFQCSNCPDFDLCSKCVISVHKEHVFLRFSTAKQFEKYEVAQNNAGVSSGSSRTNKTRIQA